MVETQKTQEKVIWEASGQYVSVAVDNHGSDVEVFFIEKVWREDISREIRAVLHHNWPYGMWVKGGSTDSMVVREGSLVIMVYYLSTAQTELYCGITVKGEVSRVREVELSNVRVVECPSAKELGDVSAEMRNRGYWYDAWFFPYMPHVIALIKRLYGIWI